MENFENDGNPENGRYFLWYITEAYTFDILFDTC